MEKKMKQSKKLLTNKILFSGLLILIQLIIVFVAFLTIHRSSRFFVYLFKLISVLAALYIINKDDASAYKITWLVLIAAVPFVGGVLYVFLGDKKPSQRLQFAFLKQIKNQRIIENDIIEEVADPYIKGQMNYLNQQRYPTYYGQDLKYFSLGDDAFEPLLESLRNAKKFIFMQFFIVDEGKMLKSVLDILKEKVKEGVEVRFMYDDVGSLTMLPRHYDRQLEKMGIKSVAFNPFIPVLSLAMNNRDHKKIVVIDGEIGFSGGFNLADEYINQRVKYGHWKDSGLMIHGPAVNSLTKMFLESWNVARNTGIKNSTGEIVCFLDDDDWYLETKIEKQLEFLCKNKDYKAIDLKVNIKQPKINTEAAKSVNTLLAEFSTKFSTNDSNRVTNIVLSAKATSDVLLMPGEEFSYNNLTGKRTKSNGYKDAPVIINGKLEQDVGGGVCQVSSTLFNSVLYSTLLSSVKKGNSLLTNLPSL